MMQVPPCAFICASLTSMLSEISEQSNITTVADSDKQMTITRALRFANVQTNRSILNL